MDITKVLIYVYVLFFIGAGLNHFLNPQFYDAIVPSFIPFPRVVHQFTGILEIVIPLLLFTKYRKTDLTIIATTSNSFNQEFDNPDDIKKICLVNYNVGFITSSPIEVKGQNIHPIYKWIKKSNYRN